MRPSNRSVILKAAAAVVEREGVTTVTLDSVAAEAGLTKGGLMYHFPTRDALLQAVHAHLAAQWEAGIADAAGGAPDEVGDAQRRAAYITVASRSATRAELLFMLEGANTPAYVAPWNDVLDRWAPAMPAEDEDDPAALTDAVARLAADGLWMYESLTGTRLSDRTRQRLTEHLIALTEQAD